MAPRSEVQGNNGFHSQQGPAGEVLVCAPLAAVAPHLFTTRAFPHATRASWREAYGPIAKSLGVASDDLADADQVHGKDVVFVTARDGAALDRPRADILVTSDPRHAVVVRVADCVPILLADPESGAVAAVHAGWRGTCAGAATAAVDALSNEFAARPSNLVAAIGPSIGPCCYQVGEDVRAAFDAAQWPATTVTRWFARDHDRWRLDLWTANRDQLVAAGVSLANIHSAHECTASAVDRYFSYRVEGVRAGRMFAAIRPPARTGG